MVSPAYSLRDAINILKQHQDKLKGKIGASKLEKLLFNLEEISLDIENVTNGERRDGKVQNSDEKRHVELRYVYRV